MCDKDREYKALEKVFNRRERNSVEIIDIDMEKSGDDFDTIYENEWFIVIDKQWLGETIGRKYVDDIQNKNRDFMTDDERLELLVEIEEITDEIRHDVFKFASEYIGQNIV